METELKFPTKNTQLIEWVKEAVHLCEPANVHFCDGSKEESDRLFEQMVKEGSAIKLTKRENCYLFRSDPADVARVEDRTFICSTRASEAGPTNNWRDPKEMKTLLKGLAKGCMQGRTMFIIPFSMGPLGSDIARIGVQITDSPYVVVSMRIMTRVDPIIWKMIAEPDKGFFVKCFHSVGCPVRPGQKSPVWPCDPKNIYVTHFPEERSIWSFGSGYGGNALLGKKCLSLRIASVMGRDEGWLAEHMLILGAESPEGEKTYITAAFPSQCGKTNFAMITPPPGFEGWKITTVGDDIAWISPGPCGYLRAINPENGFFGVAPGTSNQTNPVGMEICRKDSIFTNVALTDDGDVWWEGMTEETPKHLIDWKGNDWTPESKTPAAHSNARFTSPLVNCSILDQEWNNPKGVPVKAFCYGGRRMHDVPLVYQAFNWTHGVYLAATVSSETTSAAVGEIGKLRHDPMAMTPFCGYHMGDYFRHYISIIRKVRYPPRVFHVNWFRKDQNNKYMWPGYGQNMRVLKWIAERANGHGFAFETPLGWMPRFKDIEWKGLETFTEQQWDALMAFDHDRVRMMTLSDEELFLRLWDKMPNEMLAERQLLVARL